MVKIFYIMRGLLKNYKVAVSACLWLWVLAGDRQLVFVLLCKIWRFLLWCHKELRRLVRCSIFRTLDNISFR